MREKWCPKKCSPWSGKLVMRTRERLRSEGYLFWGADPRETEV